MNYRAELLNNKIILNDLNGKSFVEGKLYFDKIPPLVTTVMRGKNLLDIREIRKLYDVFHKTCSLKIDTNLILLVLGLEPIHFYEEFYKKKHETQITISQDNLQRLLNGKISFSVSFDISNRLDNI